ncbi:MAG TPA: gamma-glutamylcyclotransferase [Pyrinomonadaceae bacterium]|nr:gamma-glutamylcyclotransferase [Pyrinomonadaceae bacterium]
MASDGYRIRVFFYGSFMSTAVLRQHKADVSCAVSAKLDGYQLSVRPRATLEKRNGSVVYGSLAFIKACDVSRLYEQLRSDFGITYRPFPVQVEIYDGTSRDAVCFISYDEQVVVADPSYVRELAECAKDLKVPDDYIRHIMSFTTRI